jgi:cellulose biosynthesis protein BcsQ
MPAKPLRSVALPQEPQGLYSPLLPTVVVASYKGGVGKTALAVACAERLAWAGLNILLLTCDSQEDARARLGVQPAEPLIARRAYGPGSVTVMGIRGTKAIDLLYRLGTEHLGFGSFDGAVLDTPPEVQGGSLPGVLLITPLDGVDAARNLITMLGRTPPNSEVILVRVGRADAADWAQNAEAISDALERSLEFLPTPLPKSALVEQAHNLGRSVWTLQRSGSTLAFLQGVNSLAQMVWERFTPRRPWPAQLPPVPSAAYVPGWDDET